jgi:hypothetical protein
MWICTSTTQYFFMVQCSNDQAQWKLYLSQINYGNSERERTRIKESEKVGISCMTLSTRPAAAENRYSTWMVTPICVPNDYMLIMVCPAGSLLLSNVTKHLGMISWILCYETRRDANRNKRLLPDCQAQYGLLPFWHVGWGTSWLLSTMTEANKPKWRKVRDEQSAVGVL